ncbi:diacylglycerol/lipid kinase family protein [Virgibacillus kekensis]|uniref:diacylglycerol kinase (ATP) n=1 Tax=Virgibacillus kekensis TaxID=202261 RepID=A0ABV9DEL9_9BACI
MYIFIINPAAGNGKAKKALTRIKRSSEFKRVDSYCFFTEYPGHAEEIADQVSAQYKCQIEAVIIIGGDGTLYEVMNGLHSTDYPVSFIPAGSGNDFARGCRIEGPPEVIFERIVSGAYKQVYWLGNYQADNIEGRIFVNSIGIGFDAEVAGKVNRSSYKKMLNKLRIGKITYIIALIQTLFTFKPMTLEVVIDGKHRYLQNCWMITMANHPYYGGGMKIIPQAEIQPEKLPVLIIHSISKWKVLSVFLIVFTGHHTRFKEVEIVEAKKVKVKSDSKITYQVDGQTSLCEKCTVTKQDIPFQVLGA